jgi:hypothetical protein
VILTTRPLTDRSWVGTKPRTRSQFTATWTQTLQLLEREVYILQTSKMDDPVLMMDITEADLRIDGQVRANARPSSDAVALAFESRKGPLVFRCDRFLERPWGAKMIPLWQHNVRAIALTLEALRKVDRYGATQHDEQYTGYRQLAAEPAVVPTSVDEAMATLRELAGMTGPHDVPIETLISRARRGAHPDAGGSREEWDRFTEASEVVSR